MSPSNVAEPQGVAGNRRLTGASGALLLVLLAVEGVTVLRVRQLITLHVFLGVLLIGPVLLKSGSTAYRFLRYYSGSDAYRSKGPPHPVLRVLGPVVILTSLVLLGSGVGLLAVRPGRGGLLLLTHKASFVLWFAVMTVHVLAHLREAVRDAWLELKPSDDAPRGRSLRLTVIGLSLVAGVGAAAALLPTASPWLHR